MTIADLSILGTITSIKVCLVNLNQTRQAHFTRLFLQEFGYDLTKHPKLNDWYKSCEHVKGFEENADGAKYLAKRIFQLLDDTFWKEKSRNKNSRQASVASVIKWEFHELIKLNLIRMSSSTGFRFRRNRFRSVGTERICGSLGELLKPQWQLLSFRPKDENFQLTA